MAETGVRVLHAGDVFEDPTTGASVEIVSVPEAGAREPLEMRRVLKPRSGRTPPHVHVDFVERFEVESGTGAASLDGNAVTLHPGDDLTVPAGTSHVNAHNRAHDDLVMRHLLEPATDFGLGYVEALGRLMRLGRVDRQGEVPFLAALALGHDAEPGTYLAGVPHALQRAMLPLGARLARLRGY